MTAAYQGIWSARHLKCWSVLVCGQMALAYSEPYALCCWQNTAAARIRPVTDVLHDNFGAVLCAYSCCVNVGAADASAHQRIGCAAYWHTAVQGADVIYAYISKGHGYK